MQLLLDLLKDYKRHFDKINELVKTGQLMAVKRGFYSWPGTGPTPAGAFPVGQLPVGPSYISLESALSHWSFIPERVYETVSVTIRSSKTYKTSVGRFSYFREPLPFYSFGIRSAASGDNQWVLIASSEKGPV